MAELYWRQGKSEAAESLFRIALDGRRRVLGPNHPDTAATLATWGEMKLAQNDYAEAERLLTEALSIYEKSSWADWRAAYAQAMEASAIAGLGRRAEARPLAAAAHAALSQQKETIPAEKRQILDTVTRWKAEID
jgi:tetratricopeptide (TPR) repeat protein